MDIKVLAIENDNEYVDLITGALEKAGIAAYSLTNAEKALGFMKDLRPSLVLLNLATPGTNGLEVTKKIHTSPEFHDTPILLLTLMEGKFNDVYTKNYGIVGFLKKPFTHQALLEKIGAVLHADIAGAASPELAEPPAEAEEEAIAYDETPATAAAPDAGDFGAAHAFETMDVEETVTFDLGADASAGEGELAAFDLSADESASGGDFGGGFDDAFGKDQPEEEAFPVSEEAFAISDEEAGGLSFDEEPIGADAFGGGAPPEEGPEEKEPVGEGTQRLQSFGPSSGDADPFGATLSLDAFQQAAHEAHDEQAAVAASAQKDALISESPSLQEAQTRKGKDKAAKAGINFGDEEDFSLPAFGPEPSPEPKPAPARPSPKYAAKKKKGGGKTVLILLAVLLVAVLGGGAAYFFLFYETGQFAGIASFMTTETDMATETETPSPAAEAPEVSAPEPAPPAGEPSQETPPTGIVMVEKKPVEIPPAPEAPKAAQAPKAALAEAPAKVPAAATSGHYVQFGIFSSEGNASSLASRLSAQGIRAKVVATDGGKFNRVLLDEAFGSKKAASAKAAEIKSAHGLETAIYKLN